MNTVEEEVNKETIENLFKIGAHFGFTKSRRHPSAKPFIFGAKNKIEIFDLEKTSKKLEEAKDFVKSLGASNSQILFVGGKNEAREAIRSGAEEIGMPYVAGRWIGGTLTNFPEVKKRVAKLESLIEKKEKGELGKYTKKERLLIDRDIEKLTDFFGGIVPMKNLPKAVFVIDSKKEHTAILEAKQIGLPIVSLSGSDCNLDEVDYPIPANDSSIASIKFFVSEIVSAYEEGQRESKNQ